MFGLISNSPFSNVLAPPVSPLDEFIFHWNSFSSFFGQNGTTNGGDTSHIGSTNLPAKLVKMAEIVVTEQIQFGKKNKDSSTLCSTLEYILADNVLETLSLMAQADTPVGICPHILMFVARILTDSKATLIPHKSVHVALNKLMIICGKIQASPYESTEIYFLTLVVKLITKNPEYLEFFLANSFPLINSLLAMLYSEDSDVSNLAGSYIVKLIEIVDANAAKIITEETPFCCKIIGRMIDHYTAIPPTLKPEEIERIQSALPPGQNNVSEVNLSTAVRRFLSFLRWYILFDMVVYFAKDSILVSNLFNEYTTNFLESFLRPDLAGQGFETELDAIDSVFLATVIITNCLRNTQSTALFDLNCHFLFITETCPPDKEILPQKKSLNLPAILTKRCHIPPILNRCDDEEKAKFFRLSLVTLQLLDDVFTKPSYKVVHHLIIKHICNRDYLDDQPEDHSLMLEKPNVVSSHFNSIKALDQMHAVARKISSLPNVKTQASFIEWEHLNHILLLFTSLIPDELKCDKNMQYDLYETIKGFEYFMENCFSKWNLDVIETESHSLESEPFIETLFDNLEAFFQLPYEINLQMFSIWAKISLIPNVFINEYFLNPTISLKAERRSLFNILHRLVEDLQRSVQGIDQLHAKLIATKKSLLGEESQKQFLPGEPTIKILHSLIVLEEFCKQLSSIIFVKNFVLKLCKETND